MGFCPTSVFGRPVELLGDGVDDSSLCLEGSPIASPSHYSKQKVPPDL
jgi:hypothetical protein